MNRGRCAATVLFASAALAAAWLGGCSGRGEHAAPVAAVGGSAVAPPAPAMGAPAGASGGTGASGSRAVVDSGVRSDGGPITRVDGGASGAMGASSRDAGADAAGAGDNGAPADAGAPGGEAPAFILGADVSSVQEASDRGTRYFDSDGRPGSVLAILKNHGFNYIRLRTFVNPMAPNGYAGTSAGCERKAEPYCDKGHTIAFAREVKAAGMGLLLDFHYSDTWADPGKQIIPEAWRDATTVSDMASRLKGYTKDVVTALVAAGAAPDMVQVGNEITAGMLIHVPDGDTDCWGNGAAPRGNGVTGSSASANWDNLALLLKAGIAGVKEVDEHIDVMLHVENTDDLAGVRSWVSSARARGVEFDVLGLSCYPAYQGTPAVWQSTFRALAAAFPELSFAIAEYNPEPRRANEIMRELAGARGLGTFLWEPTQGGAWGRALFTCQGSECRANAADFQVFDQIRRDYGL